MRIEDCSYIYGFARTPIGKFHGALAGYSATDLGGFAIAEAVCRSGVAPEKISQVIMGNVLSAGLGQAPARQAAIKGGLPESASGTTVNKVCGSGMAAVIMAHDAVRLRHAEYAVAGGMESMSNAPFCLERKYSRRLGTLSLTDSLVHDGLWDSFLDKHMGEIAELQALIDGFGREEQDRFALQSYRRAREAQNRCFFSEEIVPVPTGGKGEEEFVEKDEQPYANDLAKLTKLPPVFDRAKGTVTAGNASKINDGASALLIGEYDHRERPLARIIDYASHAMRPDEFPVAPVGAILKLLEQWGVGIEDIDLFEINEAFAVTTLAVIRRLGLDERKVNARGGAVALGHPIGSSGARILITLLSALHEENMRRGVAAICLGGGEALALGVELVD